MPQPIQPIAPDDHGVLRFKPNAIVRFLLDGGPHGLNDLAIMDFSVEDREQFAQLIGYSLHGFGELHYVTEETYQAAEITLAQSALAETLAIRISYLRGLIESLKDQLREPIAKLYGIHPDDLMP